MATAASTLTHLQVLEAELQVIKIEEASLRERALSLSRELLSSKSFVADRERRLEEVRRLLDRVGARQRALSARLAGCQSRIWSLPPPTSGRGYGHEMG